MIIWDFNVVVAFLMTIFVFLVLFFWFFLIKAQVSLIPPSPSVEIFRQCPYCTHVFIGYQLMAHLRCPCCLSLLGQGKENIS